MSNERLDTEAMESVVAFASWEKVPMNAASFFCVMVARRARLCAGLPASNLVRLPCVVDLGVL